MTARSSGGGSYLELVRLSEVKPKPIDWLWPGRIAKGKITFIAGHPGLGKSQITASIAATVSTGGLWPVDEDSADTGDVLILSAEDGIADTIQPRIVAAGGDTRRIEVIEAVHEGVHQRMFSLRQDLERLSDTAASLLIIDPLGSFLHGIDSHRDSDVRTFLAPLFVLAEKMKMAVVCVAHLNKSTGREALSRISGSMAFIAAARAAYVVTADPDDDSRRFFLPLKNNLGPNRGGLAFRIESKEPEPGIMTSAVAWESELVNLSADEALESTDPEERRAVDDAKEFLEVVLADGPCAVKNIEGDAKNASHAWATIRRAKQALGITTKKQGMKGPWVWQLPAKALNGSEDAHAPGMSTFEEDEHLRGKDET